MATGHQLSAVGVAADSVSRPTPRLWFVTEIQHMMYGFGDCRRPLAETAGLIEEIVYRQMVELLYKAEEVGHQRETRFLGIEDFLFLLRRDKRKLKRLLQYLEFKDIKMVAVKGIYLDGDDPTELDIRQTLKKRLKICYDFLHSIDQKGDLLALFEDTTDDEIKQQRKLRAELQSRNMDTQQYLEFCEARQASFTPHYKMGKFKEWLLGGVTLDIKPGPLALEVLSYFAYETVAEIVDFALIVKKDANVRIENPLGVEMAAQCTNLDAFTASSSGSRALLSSACAPNATSPSTPSASFAGESSGPGVGPTTVATTRLKAKKRKMLGAHLSRELVTGSAITPGEVREALRRFL